MARRKPDDAPDEQDPPLLDRLKAIANGQMQMTTLSPTGRLPARLRPPAPQTARMAGVSVVPFHGLTLKH